MEVLNIFAKPGLVYSIKLHAINYLLPEVLKF